MSADTTLSQFLDGEETTDDARESRQLDTNRAHLSGARPDNIASEFSADTSRERWCRVCDQRVTIAQTRSGEYGHSRSSEHSIMGGDE